MSKLSYPSTRPRPHPAGQRAWSVDAKEDPETEDVQATIIHHIDTTNCGPLLGAEEWRPSILAVDPKSRQLFVAETGLPRVKVGCLAIMQEGALSK